MTFKEVLAPIISLEADEMALRVVADLAARFDAHATALVVSIWAGSEFAHEQRPLSEALADLAAGAQSQSALERGKIIAWLERNDLNLEVRQVSVEAAVARYESVAHARMADLVVARRCETHAHVRRELMEDMLFKSGRPVMVLPPETSKAPDWDRILIAWNARAEGVRAVVAALPLLCRAKQVRVVTVDAARSAMGHGEPPGRELATYLARHGVTVEVCNLDGLGREHSRALSDAAMDFGADLVVMGAYGHSRAREFVLGGVTRELLREARVPLFLAH